MMAVAPLIVEHNLIKRMAAQIRSHVAKIEKEGKLDVLFIDTSVDFMRTYADKCHHGKEEDILFKALLEKPLNEDERRTIAELMSEHNYERHLTRELDGARQRYARGDLNYAMHEAVGLMKKLVEFHEPHIAKEEQHLFLSSGGYFTQEEHNAMLAKFEEHDRKLIHEKYQSIVKEIEG
jgi:hemerythrin-like domain-containing protein